MSNKFPTETKHGQLDVDGQHGNFEEIKVSLHFTFLSSQQKYINFAVQQNRDFIYNLLFNFSEHIFKLLSNNLIRL